MTIGRPTVCTSELIEKAQQYLINFADIKGDVIPTVQRLARVLGVSRSTVYRWAGDADNEFKYILDDLNCDQCADLINKGLDNKFGQNTVKLMLGKHGITEKTSTEISGPGGTSITHTDLSSVGDDELKRRLALQKAEYERSEIE